MRPPLPSIPAQMSITPPRRLTLGAALAVNACGLLLALPILISMLVVSVLHFGILTFLIPLLTLAAATLFLPFRFGNPYVTRLVRSLHPPAAGQDPDGFVVQLTLTPRIRSGLRALLEDADDIGWLSFTGSELVFYGDSVRLSIPFERIRQVRRHNIGLRGLFSYGSRVTIEVSGLPNVKALEFGERSSWLLPASHKTARKLYERLSRTAVSDVPARADAACA